METPQVIPGNFSSLSLSELYDLLADETVRFNQMLLHKMPKEELNSLKIHIKLVQEEIRKRKENELQS